MGNQRPIKPAGNPTANRVEKKHRVAVLRAIDTITGRTGERQGNLEWMYSDGRGATRVLFDYANVMSYGLARLKASNNPWHPRTEEELPQQLQPGADHHKYVIPGGHWYRHVKEYIAERDGDQEDVEKLAAEREHANAILYRQLAMLGAARRR